MEKKNGAGILPIAFYNNKIYILCAREQKVDGWDGSRLYSDFGGRLEKKEGFIDCAVRECYEESMGLFGSKYNLRKKIKKDTVLKYIGDRYCCYFIKINYDKNLEDSFNRFFGYIKTFAQKSNNTYKVKGSPKGYFEKDKIRWFCLKDILEKKDNELKKNFRRVFIKMLRRMDYNKLKKNFEKSVYL